MKKFRDAFDGAESTIDYMINQYADDVMEIQRRLLQAGNFISDSRQFISFIENGDLNHYTSEEKVFRAILDAQRVLESIRMDYGKAYIDALVDRLNEIDIRALQCPSRVDDILQYVQTRIQEEYINEEDIIIKSNGDKF